jgi:hypothetical protein
MNAFFTIEHSNATLPVTPVFAHKVGHHQFVGAEQVLFFVGVEFQQQLVCVNCVFHFLNFVWRPQHSFPFQNGGHLLNCHCVVLDGQR